MLSRLDLRGQGEDAFRRLPRPRTRTDPPIEAVRAILAEVRARGDDALRELGIRFDGLSEPIGPWRVPPEACQAALRGLPVGLRRALEAARDNIETYHAAQITPDLRVERGHLRLREVRQAVDRAGLYVPGGQAPLMSTVLMTAVPARVAGVAEIALCTPPNRTGEIAPGLLAAAALAGVDEVYGVGGAQAIAAMAYGTASIAKVDVIVGPGNVYVSLAQREVAGVVGVPSSFAGPSEVVVVADETVPPDFVAIDLMVQVEHGPDSVAWLVAWSEDVITRVLDALDKLVAEAPRREVIAANLSANGFVALVDGPREAVAVVNALAPEHLELLTADPESLVGDVRHAGAVFCGPWAPASVGDYLAGTNHVLPTAGSARYAGALRVDDFCKHIHVVTMDGAALAEMAPHVIALAEAEGLPTHAESVRIRGHG